MHLPKFFRTWPRACNLGKEGFEIHLLTEKGEGVTSNPDLEVSCVVVE